MPAKAGADREKTQLFTVRVWWEPTDGGRGEWRGEVRRVPSGERGFFREWGRLVDFLRVALGDDAVGPAP